MELAELDGCASFFKGFLGVFGIVFAGFFEDWAWCVVDQSLSLTKAEAGDFFDCFDDSDFLGAAVLEGDGEF